VKKIEISDPNELRVIAQALKHWRYSLSKSEKISPERKERDIKICDKVRDEIMSE
jgi:hypothetical protein